METVRHWALSLCICCVLSGILRWMLPSKGAGKVIKSVLALYILLSASAPPQQADWGDFWNQLQKPPELEAISVFTWEELAQEQFCRTLQMKLESLLLRDGVDAEVEVHTITDQVTNQIGIEEVHVIVAQEDQAIPAGKLMKEYLGSIPVRCSTKDGET